MLGLCTVPSCGVQQRYKILFFEDAFGESTLAIAGANYKVPPGESLCVV